ncbi:MAG: hypothetical protein RIS92_2980 [Verrucomicrobiota bacterium]
MATDGDVFAGFGDGFLTERFEVSGWVVEDGFGQPITESAEVFVACDEVCFAVYFDEGSCGLVCGECECDDAFTGFAIGFFGGIGCAFFPEDIDGGFEVTLCFDEGGFAFHHACVGFVAEGFDGFGIDLDFAHNVWFEGWLREDEGWFGRAQKNRPFGRFSFLRPAGTRGLQG